jgi:hypothetical protein
MKFIAMPLLLLGLSAVAAPLPIGNGCNGTCLPSCELPPYTRGCMGAAYVNGHVLSCREDRPLNQQLFWRRLDNGLGYYYPPAQICGFENLACAPHLGD